MATTAMQYALILAQYSPPAVHMMPTKHKGWSLAKVPQEL
jgi:hypothetical protein